MRVMGSRCASRERSDSALLERMRRTTFAKDVTKFFDDEKPLAVIEETRAPGDGGTIFVQSGGSYKKDEPIGPPFLVMSAEHFGRISQSTQGILQKIRSIGLSVGPINLPKSSSP